MKSWAKAFYKSDAWLECRASYISSLPDDLCERCQARSETNIVPGYIVHHKIELTPQNINDPEIALNHDNLEYVCLDCHNTEHLHKTKLSPRRYTFTDDGQLAPLPPFEK